jgi:hypothetical protein
MKNMFYNCFSLLDIPLFDISNITQRVNLNYIFSNCYLLSKKTRLLFFKKYINDEFIIKSLELGTLTETKMKELVKKYN